MIADSNFYREFSENFSGLAVFAAGLLFFQLCPLPITGKIGGATEGATEGNFRAL